VFKVTVICEGISVMDVSGILDSKLPRFKTWEYQGSTYASFKTKTLLELSDINQRIATPEGSQFRTIKIEKVRRFWRI